MNSERSLAKLNGARSPKPTFLLELKNIRAGGQRSLGGVVCTDSWRVAQGAQRMDLFTLYMRGGDTWTQYDLAPLRDLDVLLHIADTNRIVEAVAAVSRADPRSLRLAQPDGSHITLFGREHAIAEFVAWWIARAKLAARAKAVA